MDRVTASNSRGQQPRESLKGASANRGRLSAGASAGHSPFEHQTSIQRLWRLQRHNVTRRSSTMALPLPPGLTPPEIAFLCEMELVTVMPRQRLEGLELLGVRAPPKPSKALQTPPNPSIHGHAVQPEPDELTDT